MEITKQFLTEKFREFNRDYFDNEIPLTGFGFLKGKSVLGVYSRGTKTIKITTYYKNITQHDVEEILIHEMVHAWQHATGKLDRGAHHHHGDIFYAKANQVNMKSMGKYHISRCTYLSDETIEGGSIKPIDNKHALFMCKKSENDPIWYIGKVTESARMYFPNWLGKYYTKVECIYVDKEGAKFFNDFTISRKRFNYYKVSDDIVESEIMPHIKRRYNVNLQQASATR